VDRTNADLKLVSGTVIALAALDTTFGVIIWAQPCASCTHAQFELNRDSALAGFLADLAVVALAYFGLQARTAAYVTALLVECARVAIAFFTGNLGIAGLNAFSAICLFIGAVLCMRIHRSAAILAAIRKLPPLDPDDGPPTPWDPARRSAPP
jgi:hypothetical protein